MGTTTISRFYATKTGAVESDGWSVVDCQFSMFVAQALDRKDAETICAILNADRANKAAFPQLVKGEGVRSQAQLALTIVSAAAP